jgi:hypothetical protein
MLGKNSACLKVGQEVQVNAMLAEIHDGGHVRGYVVKSGREIAAMPD